jgi:hypothetical protein
MRYLVSTIFGFVLVVGAVFLFNLKVDSAGIQARLPNPAERQTIAENPAYADIWTSRQVARALPDAPVGIEWKEKYEKGVKFWLAMEGTSDCYVLGSSRVYQVSYDSLAYAQNNCDSLINLHGPTFTTLNDLMFMAVLSRSARARRIIVGFPPWLLSPVPARLEKIVAAQGGIVPFLDSFRFMSEKEVIDSVFFGSHAYEASEISTRELLSLRYFMINAVRLFEFSARDEDGPSTGTDPLVAAGLKIVDESSIDSVKRYFSRDGSSGFPAANFQPWAPPQTQDAAHIRKLFKPMESLLTGPYVSEQSKQYWIDGIRYFRSRGIEVLLFPVPFNPWVYDRCAFIDDKSPICEALNELPAHIDEIAEISGATVLTGYDPRPYNVGSQDFVDSWHMMSSGVEKLPSN